MGEPGDQRAAQQTVVIHALELRQRPGELIGLPAAAQTVEQHRQHQILIKIAAHFRHTLLAHHHSGARRPVRTCNAARPGKEVTQRDTHPEMSALFHPLQQLLNAAAMIILIVTSMPIQGRFQHHHFGQ